MSAVNEEKLKEMIQVKLKEEVPGKMFLIEQRFSKNGQGKVQNSFQFMNKVEGQMSQGCLQNASGLSLYGNGEMSVENRRGLPKNKEADENENQIGPNDNVFEDEQPEGQEIRKGDTTQMAEWLEHENEDNEEEEEEENAARRAFAGSLDQKNNIWNKPLTYYRNQKEAGSFNYDSNDFLAPQEKLSELNSLNHCDFVGGNQQHQQNVEQQRQMLPEQELFERNNPQQLLQISGGNINNFSMGESAGNNMNGNLANGHNQYNNIITSNNPLIQNSREKNQKSTAKKRKTTQTTLPLTKLRKYDNSSIAGSIQQGNRPRLSSESSNSNEIALSVNPPAGNLKITNFFQTNQMRKTVSPKSTNADSLFGNTVPPQKETISPSQVYNHQPSSVSATASKKTQPAIIAPAPSAVVSPSQGTLIEESRGVNSRSDNASISLAHLQSPSSAQNSSVLPPHQTYQSILKVQSVNQMVIVDPKLELKYTSLQEDLKNKDLELSEKNSLLKFLEQDKRELDKALRALDQNFNQYRGKVQKIIQQQLLDIEKLRREEARNLIAKEKQRLGEYVQTRDCTKFDEIWQEGTEFKKIKDRLKVIEQEKDELEKKKRTIKGSRKSNSEPDISQDIFISEAKQRTNLQLQFLQKEESDLLELYKSLDHEKFLFVQKLKRFQDEQNSRYGQSWPLLGDRYQLLSLLGRGGFSEVYKAYDMHEFKEVACKIHQLNLNWSEPSKANYIKHAVRESKIHSELKHPNIVQLFDTVEIDNNSFATILEYCEGPDLYFYLKKNKILSEKEAKMLVKQILSALKYMNSQKTRIIHYDLKPQNIIFHKGELKISDFGLSKIFEDGQTRMELTSQGVGTYWYLPPETFEFESSAQISPKVDIWSVGVIFFEMVFGQRPFGNNKSQDQILKENIILKSTQVNFPNKPNISIECKEFIRNCLTYDQNRRWEIQKAWDCPYMSAKVR